MPICSSFSPPSSAPGNEWSTSCVYKYAFSGYVIYIWSHIICSHLYLAFLSQHKVLEFHPCCSMSRQGLYFYFLLLNSIPLCHFYILLSLDGHLNCFIFAMNIHKLCGHVSYFLGQITNCEIAESDKFMFNYSRNY